MNPYFYFFYRLNQFFNKKDNNEWGPIFGVSVFIGWNIGIVYISILPITQENFGGFYKNNLIIILVCLFIFNSILFLNKKRVSSIMERYGKESLTSRKIGGFLIVLYVALSLGLILFI
ncbi:MAG: hypothetical protein COB12_06705 [Flavobacterium sp.]|nr:MAG: hypothetical protein COB12_06705 [Flavobacterium sp.]